MARANPRIMLIFIISLYGRDVCCFRCITHGKAYNIHYDTAISIFCHHYYKDPLEKQLLHGLFLEIVLIASSMHLLPSAYSLSFLRVYVNKNFEREQDFASFEYCPITIFEIMFHTANTLIKHNCFLLYPDWYRLVYTYTYS